MSANDQIETEDTLALTTSSPETRDADVLTTIRRLLPELSKAHQRIAEMVLADPHWAMQSNVEELSMRADVAKPTVVRFTRAVGCEGLKDFKLKLAGTLALGANYLHRAVHATDTIAEVVNNVVGSSLSAVADWHRRLNPALLAEAAEALDGAGRIDCCGTGQTSNFMAQDLQGRLFRMGMPATASTDHYLQLVAAATLSAGDALVAISFVGRMPSLLETVAMAKSRGATIVSITRDGTPLARASDIVLSVDVPADATMPVGIDAYITQMLTIEILSILIGRLRGPECVRRLDRIHRVLQAKERDSDASSVVYWGWKSPPGGASPPQPTTGCRPGSDET